MGLGALPEGYEERGAELYDFEYGIPLNDKYTVKVIPLKKGKYKYYFYNSKHDITTQFEGKPPLELTQRSTVGKELKKHIDPKGKYNNDEITKQFDSLKQTLDIFVDEFNEVERETRRKSREDELLRNKSKHDDGLKVFESHDNPLIYVASLCDWYTAGERINTMIAFLCYCSQVILRNPISVIGLGEGSSGKTFIETTALSMIPDEFIRREKKPTFASMFRRAEKDTHYYDGKIVVYGDLGGSNDHDEVEDTKNLLKELQTDGFVSRPITIKIDGEYVVKDLELHGFPCLTYTSVPNYDFDSQELSRSFVFTPRTNNRHVFNSQRSILELVGGRTQQIYKSMLDLQEDVISMVYGLRGKFSDIFIVNPYSESILKFIGESEYYKRDYDKYNSILKVITAFNSDGREVFEIGGRKILFTQPKDVQYFVSLFASYKSSITHNLSRKATDIYKDIMENKDKFEYCYTNEDFGMEQEDGFTVQDYMDFGNVTLKKRSLQRYFSELNNEGYLKVVGKRSKSNVYVTVADSVESVDWDNLYMLSDESRDRLYKEYPSDIVEHIISVDNCYDEEVSILDQHNGIDKPNWVNFDD